jgi:hypothetical protein
MNKTVLAIATVVAALSISATGLAQSQKGMENGKRKGWYKNGKIDSKKDSRYNQNRREDDKRWDDRKDDRWDNRNDSRYDNRNDSWRQTNDNRYDSRYNNNSTYQNQSNRRQDTKNEWRNIAYGAGAVALLGVLQKDNRLVFGGAAGALYSLWRYEQDRKSQNSLDRARANYFSNDYFTRDGVRYDRRLVTQNGERYYQFVRAR